MDVAVGIAGGHRASGSRAHAVLGTIVLLCLTLGGITHTDGTRGAYATGGGEIRHSGVVLSALAPFPAVIDGRLNSVAGEWDAADFLDLAVNVPEGGTVPGRLYEMNDAANLYLSLRLDRRVADPRESLGFEFDNDHDGIRFEQGDDVLFLNPEIPLFYDGFRTLLPPCPPGLNCGISDTDGGGTNDGAGAFGNDGTYSVFEFSHPLDTTDDAHDFSIGPGDTVGVTMDLRLGDGNVFADSELNSADIVIPGGSSEAREVAL